VITGLMTMMMEAKLIGNEGETIRQRIGCRIYATAEEERSNADGCQWGKQKWNVEKLYRSRICVHRYPPIPRAHVRYHGCHIRLSEMITNTQTAAWGQCGNGTRGGDGMKNTRKGPNDVNRWDESTLTF